MLSLSNHADKDGRIDNRWMTYEQAQAKGWQVKKGEKGVGIVKVIEQGASGPEAGQSAEAATSDQPSATGAPSDQSRKTGVCGATRCSMPNRSKAPRSWRRSS